MDLSGVARYPSLRDKTVLCESRCAQHGRAPHVTPWIGALVNNAASDRRRDWKDLTPG